MSNESRDHYHENGSLKPNLRYGFCFKADVTLKINYFLMHKKLYLLFVTELHGSGELITHFIMVTIQYVTFFSIINFCWLCIPFEYFEQRNIKLPKFK